MILMFYRLIIIRWTLGIRDYLFVSPGHYAIDDIIYKLSQTILYINPFVFNILKIYRVFCHFVVDIAIATAYNRV